MIRFPNIHHICFYLKIIHINLSKKIMLKAILFDMDGVIVDSEPLHKKAYYKMFNDVGIDVSETSFESFTGSQL